MHLRPAAFAKKQADIYEAETHATVYTDYTNEPRQMRSRGKKPTPANKKPAAGGRRAGRR